MNPVSPIIKPSQVTKNAGKIQNLLLQFGAEMSSTSDSYTQTGSGFESRESIAERVLNASNNAYGKLHLDRFEQPREQYVQPQYNTQPHPAVVAARYPTYEMPQSMNLANNFNFTTEEDMENIDISKYIGTPKKEQQKPVQGDIGMLLKEIRETNKKLEAMCKILGLIYQQNVKNNTMTPADFGFAGRETLEEHDDYINQPDISNEDDMSVEEETEMLKNLPIPKAINPLDEDDDEPEQ